MEKQELLKKQNESLVKDFDKKDVTNWFGLFGFYGISTLVGYLMPNPFLYK